MLCRTRRPHCIPWAGCPRPRSESDLGTHGEQRVRVMSRCTDADCLPQRLCVLINTTPIHNAHEEHSMILLVERVEAPLISVHLGSLDPHIRCVHSADAILELCWPLRSCNPRELLSHRPSIDAIGCTHTEQTGAVMSTAAVALTRVYVCDEQYAIRPHPICPQSHPPSRADCC